MDIFAKSLEAHQQHKGKMEIKARVALDTPEDLATYYSPWVAAPCLAIAQDAEKAYQYTRKQNSVAVVSDGSAVLGLGNIGWLAWLPVMEGKAILMKKFADIDAVPIVLNTQDADQIIEVVEAIAPTFGAINLEDIAAPHCFYIEEQLQKKLSIPVFHDDQHGTAIVVLAWIINALQLVEKDITSARIVIAGAGAAGIATAKLLIAAWAQHIIMTDSKGIISHERDDINTYKKEMADYNTWPQQGTLATALQWADVCIGVSQPDIIDETMIQSMARQPIMFALSNPHPEITYEKAQQAWVYIYASGRSDFPNQVNNILVFPGILQAALTYRRTTITIEKKLCTAQLLAQYVQNPTPGEIIPHALDSAVAPYIIKHLG